MLVVPHAGIEVTMIMRVRWCKLWTQGQIVVDERFHAIGRLGNFPSGMCTPPASPIGTKAGRRVLLTATTENRKVKVANVGTVPQSSLPSNSLARAPTDRQTVVTSARELGQEYRSIALCRAAPPVPRATLSVSTCADHNSVAQAAWHEVLHTGR